MKRDPRTTAVWIVALCALAVVGWKLGLFDALRDPETLRATLGTGHAARAIFVIAVTALSIVGVPPIVFLVPATLVFPRHVVFALGFVIGELGGVLGYLIARTVGRSYVEPRIPPRLRAWNDRLAKHGLLTVVLLRLVFFVLPPSSWLLGVSRVRAWHVVVGTAIGILPWVWACAYVGGSLVTWLRDQPPWVWAVCAAVVIAAIAIARRSDRK